MIRYYVWCLGKRGVSVYAAMVEVFQKQLTPDGLYKISLK